MLLDTYVLKAPYLCSGYLKIRVFLYIYIFKKGLSLVYFKLIHKLQKSIRKWKKGIGDQKS